MSNFHQNFVASLIFIFASVHPWCVKAQEDIVIKGKVVDDKSNLPLGYASISIKGRGVGTVSNNDGIFEFHISKKYEFDTLSVSMLGYSKFETVMETAAAASPLTISLKESPINLKEVVIVGDTTSANTIVKRAFVNLTKTFPQDNYVLKGFYRQIDTENDRNALLIEAAIEIYDRDYQLNLDWRLREKVVVRQVRSSLSTFQSESKNYFEQSNTLTTLLKFNFTRYNNSYAMERKNFVLDSVMQWNDRIVYVISSLWPGADLTNRFTFYIDTKTLAFWKIKNESIAHPGPEHFLQNFNVRVDNNKSQALRLVASTQVYQFEAYQGRMFLSQAFSLSKGQIIDIPTGKPVREVTDENILIINEVQTGPQIDAPGKDLMDKSKNVKFLDKGFDPEFWKDYGVVKLVPLTRKQVTELEEKVPLEEQFKTKK
jgi:CarboxypepD_reg-like domain